VTTTGLVGHPDQLGSVIVRFNLDAWQHVPGPVQFLHLGLEVGEGRERLRTLAQEDHPADDVVVRLPDPLAVSVKDLSSAGVLHRPAQTHFPEPAAPAYNNALP